VPLPKPLEWVQMGTELYQMPPFIPFPTEARTCLLGAWIPSRGKKKTLACDMKGPIDQTMVEQR
jgi:hypothetical protein